jgi:hypothetical protein
MLTRKWSLLLLAPTLLCLRSAAAELEAYMAPDGKFSINFAAKPTITYLVPPSGPVKMYRAIAGTSAQMVTAMDNADLAALTTPEMIERTLDKSRDSIVGNSKAISEKKLELNNKYLGRGVILKTDQGFMHVRMYLVDTSFFMVMISGQTEEMVKSKESIAFLDSFKLGKK